jgi:CDP-diacylglycerol--serine O-phosphatidyltransferase
MGHYDHAAIAIFIALILDGLDGSVARLTNTQSDFGAEYDSLSDMVSFGVAPALIIYVWALKSARKVRLDCCIYLLLHCAAFRLARFNVKLDIDNKKSFFWPSIPSCSNINCKLYLDII